MEDIGESAGGGGHRRDRWRRRETKNRCQREQKTSKRNAEKRGGEEPRRGTERCKGIDQKCCLHAKEKIIYRNGNREQKMVFKDDSQKMMGD